MQGLFGTPMRLGWVDWFPVKDVCLDGFDASKGNYCFVDVGAGKGHEAELVLKKYPESRGKFIVEDLPFVIDDITELDERIERLPHDFTKAQPIKGKDIQLFADTRLTSCTANLQYSHLRRRAHLLFAKHPPQLGLARGSYHTHTPQGGNDTRLQQNHHRQHHPTRGACTAAKQRTRYRNAFLAFWQPKK